MKKTRQYQAVEDLLTDLPNDDCHTFLCAVVDMLYLDTDSAGRQFYNLSKVHNVYDLKEAIVNALPDQIRDTIAKESNTR